MLYSRPEISTLFNNGHQQSGKFANSSNIDPETKGIILGPVKEWAIGLAEDLPPRFRPNPRGNARTPPYPRGFARIRGGSSSAEPVAKECG